MKRIPHHRRCFPFHPRPHADLPAPHVPAAEDGKLDPFRGDSTVLIEVSTTALKVGDTIQLSVYATLDGHSNYWLAQRTLTNNDLGKPYPFHCPADRLQLDGGLFTAFYTVGTDFSEFLDLDIHRAEETGLTRPWVEGTVGGAGTELRMDDLDGGPVHVIAQDDSFVALDRITLIWEPNGGDPYSPPLKLVPANNDSVSFTVPYQVANKQGSARVHYTRQRIGADPESSLVRELRVVESTKPVRLPPPGVLEADSDGEINPLAHDELTVHIPEDAPLEANQPLTVHWVGPAPEASFDIEVPSARPGMDIPVPVASLAFSAGHTVQVTYRVTQGGVTVTSDETILLIQPIPHDSPLLPRPTFNEADEVELDMTKVGPDHAFVNIPAYRLAANDQRYWLTLSGVDLDDVPLVITIADNAPIWGASIDPIPLGTVARTDLERFKDGSEIVLDLKVTFDHSEDEAKAIHFRRRTLIIRQVEAVRFPAPSLDEADAEHRIFPLTVPSLTGRLPSAAPIQPGDRVVMHWLEQSGLGSWEGEVENPAPDLPVAMPLSVLRFALGESTALTYTVFRNDEEVSSDAYTVHVQAVQDMDPLLPRPVVVESSNGELDLGSFDGDAHVTLSTFPLFDPDQLCWASALGSTEFHIVSGEAFGDPGPTLAIGVIDRAWLEEQPDGTEITVALSVAFDGDPNGNITAFGVARVSIRHASHAFPAPTLDEATADGEILPLDVRHLTARLPESLVLEPNDTVDMHWEHATAKGTKVVPIPEPAPGASASFPLSVLAPALGDVIRLYYVVTRDGVAHTSNAYPVTILNIASSDERLPRPTIRQAVNGVLDLGKFSGDADINLSTFPLYMPGQKYWTTVALNGHFIYPATGLVFSGSAPFHIGRIPRNELDQLPDGFTVSFWVAVDFSGEKNLPENLVQFGRVNVTVYKASPISFPQPSVLEANGGLLRPEDTKEGLHVVLPPADYLASDTLQVQWRGNRVGGTRIVDVRESPTPGMLVSIDRSVVEWNQGDIVTVTFSITRSGRPFLSAPLSIYVEYEKGPRSSLARHPPRAPGTPLRSRQRIKRTM
jgi:hypothetical protein